MITQLGIFLIGWAAGKFFGAGAGAPRRNGNGGGPPPKKPSEVKWPTNESPSAPHVLPATPPAPSPEQAAATAPRPLTTQEQGEMQDVLKKGGFFGPLT